MKTKGMLVMLACLLPATLSGLGTAPQVPEDVRGMAGVYEGTWSMLGLDETGTIVQKMSWTDVMVAKDPVVRDGRAYVATLDTMTFAGGLPPQTMEGKEGYFLNPDGTLGDYFIEMNGQVQRVSSLGGKTWAYTASSSPIEMRMLGFPAAAAGTAVHVVVKVVDMADGVETHRISRVTTVTWKDKDGRDCSRQFISLQGVHKRKK